MLGKDQFHALVMMLGQLPLCLEGITVNLSSINKTFVLIEAQTPKIGEDYI